MTSSTTSRTWSGRGSTTCSSATSGANTIQGIDGDDFVFGGAGDDVLGGAAGDDSVVGGAGVDTATYAAARSAVNANLTTNTAFGGGGNDALGVGREPDRVAVQRHPHR